MSDDFDPNSIGLTFDDTDAAVAGIDLIAAQQAQIAEIQARLDAAIAAIPPLEAELADANARLAALGG